jgi:hypothetical protein
MKVEIFVTDAKKIKLPPVEDRIHRFCIRCAAFLWEGRIDGKTACVWGLVPPTLLSDAAYLWMHVDEDVVQENQFVFVRHSQRVVEEMLTQFPSIVGHCAIGRERSIRWLKWLGAEFGHPEGTMLPFQIRRKHG